MKSELEMIKGMKNYIKRIKKCEKIYKRIISIIPNNYSDIIYKINDVKIFEEVINNFVTALDFKKACGDLTNLYDIAIHVPTKSLIIANKGATLYSLSEKFEIPSVIRHIGLCVYVPKIGMEYANVGLVGNVYDDKVVLRSESACTPSFLFGSQRCNCHYQWKSTRELASYFNKINAPNNMNGEDFETWVQQQYKYENGKHLYQNESKIGFILLHIDSQNGMGSGYTKDEFVFDLAERAAMRHRGEYSAEQTYKETMYGGFTQIGLIGDPRAENDNVGYQITPIILDYLDVNKNVIMLTNNPLKIKQMQKYGYNVSRVKSIGAVNVAGSSEAKQRGEEFSHLDINGEIINFSDDFERIKEEILNLYNSNCKILAKQYKN